ncbi:MAG: hypothetical protein IJW32_04385 [Clostridia bacterium]|nr:hypothetical protein [Clostridia bacterium]
MEKIELKCSNCGGALNKIETQKDTYVCLHCGNKEIIKEEKGNTNYYINQNTTKNIYGKENIVEEDYFKLIENAEKFIKVEDYKMAFKLIKQAKDIDPGHYLVWWLSAKAKLLSNIKDKETGDLFAGPGYSIKNIEEDCKKAIAFASEKQREFIEEEYQELYKEYSQYCEDANDYVEANIGKERNLQKTSKIIVGFIIAAIIFLMSGIILSIFLKNEDVLLTFVFIGWIIIIISVVVNAYIRNNIKIIEFIKQKQEISFEDLFKYCEELNIQTLKDINSLKNRVANLIENGNLVNYKIEKDFIIKV